MKKIKTNVDIIDVRETEGVTFKELQNGSYFLYEKFNCINMQKNA